MSLINKQTLISSCCASVLLDLSESSLRKGVAGTETLTQVRRGNGKRQRISFILEEVVELKGEWIQESKNLRTILKLAS